MVDDQSRTMETLEAEIERLRADVAARDVALGDRDRELAEALEQQTAMADILRVIASSPTDFQRVLDAIADITQRLCGADAAWVQREVDGYIRTLSRAGGVDQLFV